MRTPPEWVHAQCACIYGIVDTEPGIWTARLCRLLNGVPETKEGIQYCGRCAHYANPRKRAKAENFTRSLVLPGFSVYELHPACTQWPLRMVRARAYRLLDLGYVWQWWTVIPDLMQPRGFDLAMRWYADTVERSITHMEDYPWQKNPKYVRLVLELDTATGDRADKIRDELKAIMNRYLQQDELISIQPELIRAESLGGAVVQDSMF